MFVKARVHHIQTNCLIGNSIQFLLELKNCYFSVDISGNLLPEFAWQYKNKTFDWFSLESFSIAQKQPSRGVLRKRCSENMQQIYRRTPMPKCDLLCNFIEIALRHGCSPVNLLHIFRPPFSKNTSGRLLLIVRYLFDSHYCTLELWMHNNIPTRFSL